MCLAASRSHGSPLRLRTQGRSTQRRYPSLCGLLTCTKLQFPILELLAGLPSPLVLEAAVIHPDTPDPSEPTTESATFRENARPYRLCNAAGCNRKRGRSELPILGCWAMKSESFRRTRVQAEPSAPDPWKEFGPFPETARDYAIP